MFKLSNSNKITNFKIKFEVPRRRGSIGFSQLSLLLNPTMTRQHAMVHRGKITHFQICNLQQRHLT